MSKTGPDGTERSHDPYRRTISMRRSWSGRSRQRGTHQLARRIRFNPGARRSGCCSGDGLTGPDSTVHHHKLAAHRTALDPLRNTRGALLAHSSAALSEGQGHIPSPCPLSQARRCVAYSSSPGHQGVQRDAPIPGGGPLLPVSGVRQLAMQQGHIHGCRERRTVFPGKETHSQSRPLALAPDEHTVYGQSRRAFDACPACQW